MNTIPSTLRSNTIQKLQKTRSNRPVVIYRSRQENIEIESVTPQPFDGFDFSYVKDPISEIRKCKGILIKQKIESPEFITGFETCNKYYIFGIGERGYKFLFKCEEYTNCFNKFFCPTALKEIKMKLLHISPSNSSFSSTNISNIIKPFKFSCFCIGRPEIILTLNDSSEIIGKIRAQFSCCDYCYEIINKQNQIKYIIKGNCCQCGLFCSNSICGKRCEANFSILIPKTGEQVGSIEKQLEDKTKEEENYQINFPPKANSNDKLLLTVLGLMIDYQFFEIDPLKLKDTIKKNLS